MIAKLEFSAVLQRCGWEEEQHGPVKQRNALESMTEKAMLASGRRAPNGPKKKGKGTTPARVTTPANHLWVGVAAGRCAEAKATRRCMKSDGR